MTVGRGGTDGRAVLLGAAGLHMATQSALAPFYPKLFRTAYGVSDLAATGAFLMACQLAAVIALPLWGRATRHMSLPRLVTAGQTAAVILAASLALAPSYAVFSALSVALVVAKSVVLLAYPSIARSHPRGLLPGVVQYVAVLHAASIAATLLGTVVISVPRPRLALPLLAVVETVLLVACIALLRRQGRQPAAPAPADAATAPPRAALIGLAGFVLANAVALYAVRPYFTEYATAGGASTTVAALLFVLPHLAVLAVLPAACALRRRLGAWLLPLALALAAAGLAWQAAGADVAPLAVARLLFGAGLGLGQVALDERVLTVSGTGPAYSLVAAAQTCGLLLAPMLATATASAALAAPLVAGAALCAALALIAPLTAVRTRTAPTDMPQAASPSAAFAATATAADR